MGQRFLLWFRERWEPIYLLVLGLLTRFIGLSHPSSVVWDEQHFNKFTANYLSGSYFFDIHPPLGKFLIYLPLRIAGAGAPVDFTFSSGSAYPADYPYVVSRLMPALIGGLLPLLIWLVARALGLSRRAALIAGGLLLLENAFVVESRHALIDIFLHFFIYLALLAFLRHRKQAPFNNAWWGLLAGTALACGCAVSVKWTGLAIIGVMGLVAALDAWERKAWKPLVAQAAMFAVVPLAVYAGFMAFHFSLLTNTSKGNDNAFMTPRFRAGLKGSAESQDGETYEPMSFVEKFKELNKEMYRANHDKGMKHGESSKYYEWPVMRKTIWFWVDSKNRLARIFLFGNPVAWAFGGTAMLAGLGFVFWRGRAITRLANERPEWKEKVFGLQLLFLIFAAYYLPFIGIERPMFIYHYFTAFIATVLLGALIFIDMMPALGWRGEPAMEEISPVWTWALLGVALAFFVFFSPITYGYEPTWTWWSKMMPLTS